VNGIYTCIAQRETNTAVVNDLTLHGDFAEDSGVTRQSATVPATVAKLFLTLPDGEMRRVSYAHHDVRMQTTDSALVTAEASRVVADGARSHL